MTDLPRAGRVLMAGEWAGAADRVVLDYDARFLRRKRLQGQGGLAFLVDLPETLSVDEGMAFALDDGRVVEIVAAPEPLHSVRGDLPRLAWHIGNRHTPCEIGADRLLIRRDHVLRGMLEGLGAEVEDVTGPFRPEGGAYGHGRTMGHSHGPDEGHGHDHRHGHVHHHGSHRHFPDDDDEGPADA